MKYLSLLGLLLAPFPAFADLTLQQRIDDATTLVNTFIHRYGPLPWKEELLGLDINAMSNTLMQEATDAKNDLDFYDAMIRFTAAFKDSHVSSSIPSTYSVSLPFRTDDFNGEVVLVDINREKLPESLFPFRVGDRLVHFDEKPVDQVIEELIPYKESGSLAANRRHAASLLTFRLQRKIPRIPNGSVAIGIYSMERKKEETIILNWEPYGLPLANFQERESLLGKGKAVSILPKETTAFRSTYSIYDTEPFYPLWDSFEMHQEKPYKTGIVTLQGRKIGYLRLHTWDLDALEMKRSEVIQFLAEEMVWFKANTEALLIDQTGNPGGSACLVEKVAGFFVNEPVPSIRFQIKATREWLQGFESDYLGAKPASEEKLLLGKQVSAIRTALISKKDLTEPLPICSPDGTITPRTTESGESLTYDKPKLLLIDNLDCSGGDFFPAVLQDAGTVTLLGERTIGCGGTVEDVANLGYSDFTTRVTASLMVRPKPQRLENGKETHYIENVGVSPDIECKITADDFRAGFPDYRQAVEEAVLQLIEPK